jgi:PAS domain S-box-containing protein
VTSPYNRDESVPTNEVLSTGTALFVPTCAEAVARFPRDREMVEPPLEGAIASAPLIIEGRVLGAMTLAFDHDREFEPDDRELLLALAGQCAQALERTRLYELALSVQEDLRRSRDQLAAILGGIAEGVTVQDVDGHIIYANQIAASLSGYASPEALIRDQPRVFEHFELMDEQGNPISADALPGRRILHGKFAEETVVQFRNVPTGEKRWSIVNAQPVRDEQGRLQLVVNIFRDITELKQHADATEFLAAASTMLDSTLDLNISLQQVAELAVPRICERCTIELTDAGQDWTAVAYASVDLESPARDGQRAAEIRVPLVARGETLGRLTLSQMRAAGHRSQAERDLAENLATRVALAVDNARAVGDLQEALRTRDEFLASASHDLKNPLSSIKAISQLMLRRLDRSGAIDAERARESLQRVDTIATRAAGLVEELLDLTRLQMDRPLDLERRRLDLVALAAEVVNEQQQGSERHTIDVQADYPEVLGLWDGRRLARVFSNLLDNAVKYSPEGGPVVVRVQRAGAWALVSVVDRGIGIPRAEQERIFQRFQRGSNAASWIGGTGLGLASARYIVESHGGSISVESDEGKGATFIVRLPIDDGSATA